MCACPEVTLWSVPEVERVLVSACLLGQACRWDGGDKRNRALLEAVAHEGLEAVPFCPEEAGGLGTPRPPCVLVGGDGEAVADGRAKVLDDAGNDRTEAYLIGARGAVDSARASGCAVAYLKERSPSCGCALVPTEAGRIEGCGVTTALLRRAGIATISVD